MANFVKWWKYPLFWKIFSTVIATMVITLLCVLLIKIPYGMIIGIPITISGGLIIRKILENHFKNYGDTNNKGN